MGETTDPEIAELFHIYSLCNKFKTLPEDGGILDQKSVLMDYFNIIIEQQNIEKKIKMQEMETKSR